MELLLIITGQALISIDIGLEVTGSVVELEAPLAEGKNNLRKLLDEVYQGKVRVVFMQILIQLDRNTTQ